jgi:3-deoxy-D-manno-octulosonate 8-phosphate phosphatase (KDO 8-P phosphatase)
MNLTLAERCRQIEALILDVDGVLSDGGIVWAGDAIESKTFFVRDGLAIKLWHAKGKKLALLSGRPSLPTNVRAKELGIAALNQDRSDKQPGFAKLLAELETTAERTAYVGDDAPDAPILRQVGLAVAVADACPDALRVAHYITQAPGGRGAVRETVELIMRAQGLG